MVRDDDFFTGVSMQETENIKDVNDNNNNNNDNNNNNNSQPTSIIPVICFPFPLANLSTVLLLDLKACCLRFR